MVTQEVDEWGEVDGARLGLVGMAQALQSAKIVQVKMLLQDSLKGYAR